MYSSSPKRTSNAMPYFTVGGAAAPVLILAFAICSLGQAKSPVSIPMKNSAGVTIKNFGQMNAHFYRGAQPKNSEYKELAELGVKSIIDLRDDPMPFAKSAAEAAQIRYFNIPMSDSHYPKQEAIDEFLKITSDTTNWPFYVHCEGGRHRTGLMGAVYRFNQDGWDYQKAYQEMKKYDYYSRWGHSEIKKYVKQYWQRKNTPNPDSVSVQTK
jgi:protein tyrosine/serine phosphatase